MDEGHDWRAVYDFWFPLDLTGRTWRPTGG